MKIAIISDLHLEFYGSDFLKRLDRILKTKPDPECDTLVLAGDILLLRWAAALSVFDKFFEYFDTILFVPGNHEYYRFSIKEGREKITSIQEHYAKALKKFGYLDDFKNGFFIDNGSQAVFGGTLWFPDNFLVQENKQYLTDYRAIRDIQDVYGINAESKVYLTTPAANYEGSIIISHHAPSYKSVNPKYYGHPLNCFYANNLDDWIIKNKPKMWIHGHMHDKVDYMIGETRIVSNPIDYPQHGFNPLTPENFWKILEV